MEKTKIIVICGPTATGKSNLAVDTALKLGGEIINADSMQVYKGMDIACAMPTEADKKGVPHHLYGYIEPEQSYSVAEWLVQARKTISELSKRGVMPIIVGGTGLYISSLVDNIIFDEIGEDSDFREKMYNLAATRGNSFLLEKLRSVDPDEASKLHENNVKRIVRHLEAYEQSSKTARERRENSRLERSRYKTCMLGLNFENRVDLYRQINNRVEKMLLNGLIEEARIAFQAVSKKPTASQAIGHKELFPYFKGEEKIETCIENLKMKTRNYAKRQLTWFRKMNCTKWLIMNNDKMYVHILDESVAFLDEFYAEK
ncbi:MAG: tRNA (adenosine(37)-N6)-dimethylallyltransferase MiaA [Oscillospiraceae bacterium]|nr:tRNA (adenosine(37)-N6)-dimethylallyltransferase MiaA [Oscillospiraceae bacterium]